MQLHVQHWVYASAKQKHQKSCRRQPPLFLEMSLKFQRYKSMSTCSGCFRSPMSKSKAPTPHEGSTINGRYMRPKSSSLPQKLWSSLKNTCSVVVVHIRFVDDTSNQPLTTSFSRVSNPKHSSNQGKYTHTCLSSGG